MNKQKLEPVKADTVEAIRNDRFATATIEAIKVYLLTTCTDWSQLNIKTGLPPFNDEEGAIAYRAACTLIDDHSAPDFAGIQVSINGVQMPVEAISKLTAAVNKAEA